jgi:hypothetical protein
MKKIDTKTTVTLNFVYKEAKRGIPPRRGEVSAHPLMSQLKNK